MDSSAVHLHVLLHGLWGNPSHFAEAARVFQKRIDNLPEEQQARVEVLVVESNSSDGTYDGIDWGAERAVDEIDEKIKQIESSGKQVTRFSITGYSLGGLFARYTIGILYHRGFFNTVTPVNFAVIACPNLGVPRYSSWISKIVFTVGSNLLGRTGKQFYGADSFADTGRPLLEVMADKDLIFYKALCLFPRIDVYANAVNDVTVPYVTGAFEDFDPFINHAKDRIEVTYVKGYKPLIESYSFPTTPSIPKRSWSDRLRALKPLPFPGPVVEWVFPYNIILIAILPILLPILLVLVPLRFALWTRDSHVRVQQLERSDTARARLASAFANIEKSVEQAIEDVVEQIQPNAAPTPSSTETVVNRAAGNDRQQQSSKKQPLLTPGQRRMISALNDLPNVRKHLAFIHPVRNSHAIILVRNPEFSEHAMGEGVLRHWADHFVV